mgnify:CR=1 FL=1
MNRVGISRRKEREMTLNDDRLSGERKSPSELSVLFTRINYPVQSRNAIHANLRIYNKAPYSNYTVRSFFTYSAHTQRTFSALTLYNYNNSFPETKKLTEIVVFCVILRLFTFQVADLTTNYNCIHTQFMSLRS